jgi:hypothetical protein
MSFLFSSKHPAGKATFSSSNARPSSPARRGRTSDLFHDSTILFIPSYTGLDHELLLTLLEELPELTDCELLELELTELLELELWLLELVEIELLELELAELWLLELVEIELLEELLSELELVEIELELVDTELVEIELLELLELEELLELLELEELLDPLDHELELWLLTLLELELLDRSSIPMTCSRSRPRGPGNCSEPVWKQTMSHTPTSPEASTSRARACHIWLSGSGTVTISVAAAIPALVYVAAGRVSGSQLPSPALGILVTINVRLARWAPPTPRKKITFFISRPSKRKTAAMPFT